MMKATEALWFDLCWDLCMGHLCLLFDWFIGIYCCFYAIFSDFSTLSHLGNQRLPKNLSIRVCSFFIFYSIIL